MLQKNPWISRGDRLRGRSYVLNNAVKLVYWYGHLTELQRGDEPWAREGIERALVDDVEDHVEGVPQEDVDRKLPSRSLRGSGGLSPGRGRHSLDRSPAWPIFLLDETGASLWQAHGDGMDTDYDGFTSQVDLSCSRSDVPVNRPGVWGRLSKAHARASMLIGNMAGEQSSAGDSAGNNVNPRACEANEHR